MKVGFLLFRSPVIKVYAPLIEFLLDKGDEVTIFCDYTLEPKSLGYKKYQYPYKEGLPSFKSPPSIESYTSTRELCDMIKKRNIRALFSINFFQTAKDVKRLLVKENYEIINAQLQYFLEMFTTGKDLSDFDVIYTYSDSWKQWWGEYRDKNQ